MHHGLLPELVQAYAVAVVLLVIAGRLGVPSIVALITAGILAGPNGFALVPEQESVELLSEIGVALLLFMAGLDFSMGELKRVWRGVLIGGTAQVALTVLLVAAVITAISVPTGSRLVLIGMFVALSSTAIVLKELTRINQAHSPHGKLAIGILLLQDLIVIAVLVFAPMLLGQAQGNIGLAFLRFGLVLGGIFVVSRLVLPLLLRLVSATSREAFTLAVLLSSVGTAALASMLGLSMAVGAFLAGLVLAESEFSHQVHAEVRTLRDLLASLFFISVGMLVNPSEMVSILPAVVVLALGITIVKFAGASGALLLSGAPLRIAIAGGVALSQVGEFSFVLGRSALTAGVLTPGEWQLLLGASVLTMAAAPNLVGLAPTIGARLATRMGRRDGKGKHDEELPMLADHVIILGFGIGGRLLARALGEVGTKYLILELNGASVQEGRAKGEPIFYADATVTEPLEAAGVERAAAVVCVVSDPDASERSVKAVRRLSPTVPIIVRTRFRLEAERMSRAGATIAVAEELEASLEVLAQLLMRLQIPGNVVEVLIDTYRRTTTTVQTGRSKRALAMPLSELPVEVADAPVATFRLGPKMGAVGHTLAELDLRAETGATVLAIRREGRTITSPDATVRLAANDDLYLLGDEADVLLARHRLEQGPRDRNPAMTFSDAPDAP